MVTAAPPASLAAAHAQFSRGDFVAAWATLGPLVTAHPGDAKLLQLAGLVRRGAGDLTGARDLLARSAAAGGGGEVLNTLGNVLADLGESDAADAAFVQAARAAPRDPNPWINRGRLASKRDRHTTALGHLRRAVEIAPRSVLAQVALGNALRRAGELDAAVAALRTARGLDPARASTALHLGVAQTEAGRAREAVATFDAVGPSGNASPELLHNRAAAVLALGDVAGAKAGYDALVAAHPAYLPGHRVRARLIQEYALAEDPFASYRRLADQYPGEAVIWSAWLEALIAARAYAAVRSVADEAVAAVGRRVDIDAVLAIALSELGELGAADEAFARVAAVAGQDVGFRLSRIRHLLKRGDAARAASEADAVVTEEPDNQLGWAYLGTAWRVLGDPREYWLHDYDRHARIDWALPPGDARSPDAFVADCADALRRLHVTKVHPADQTLRNGTQTPGALFGRGDPTIAALEAAVRAAVARFIVGLPDDSIHPLLRRKSELIRFNGSWSVRLTEGGFHVSHIHDRGWISSAFYFVLPERSGDEGALALGAPPQELGLALAPRRVIRPQPGQLALFPSSMWHGTLPFPGDAERLTVAFDVIPDA
ncbi:MAG: putative 2OG-Fe(II) oxygenase [Pseudomonadota bacterium]